MDKIEKYTIFLCGPSCVGKSYFINKLKKKKFFFKKLTDILGINIDQNLLVINFNTIVSQKKIPEETCIIHVDLNRLYNSKQGDFLDLANKLNNKNSIFILMYTSLNTYIKRRQARHRIYKPPLVYWNYFFKTIEKYNFMDRIKVIVNADRKYIFEKFNKNNIAFLLMS